MSKVILQLHHIVLEFFILFLKNIQVEVIPFVEAQRPDFAIFVFDFHLIATLIHGQNLESFVLFQIQIPLPDDWIQFTHVRTPPYRKKGPAIIKSRRPSLS